jgi:hypothetical protein
MATKKRPSLAIQGTQPHMAAPPQPGAATRDLSPPRTPAPSGSAAPSLQASGGACSGVGSFWKALGHRLALSPEGANEHKTNRVCISPCQHH